MAKDRSQALAESTQEPPTHEDDPRLSIMEVGRQLGRDWRTVKAWCLSGLLKHSREPGGRIVVRKSVVNRLLESSEIERRVE